MIGDHSNKTETGNPFRSKLTKSTISPEEYPEGKFNDLENDPNKIVRAESFDNLKRRYENRIDPVVLVKLGKELFNEIRTKYNILVSVDFIIGENKEGNVVVYCVTDKINGVNLENAEPKQELIKETEDLYTSISKYYLDKLNNKEAHLADLNNTSQYIYGKKKGDEQSKIYLIDTDLYINKGDVALLHNVKWLVRHMVWIEHKFGKRFEEARKNIRQIIEFPLNENLSPGDRETTLKEIREALSFLDGTYRKGDKLDNIGFIPSALF